MTEEEFDILNEETALERAAANLDLASVHANKRKDIEGLITVAAAWMQVADRLSEEFMPKKKHSLGFGVEEEEEDVFGFSKAIETEHLTDEQVNEILDMFGDDF